MKSWDWFGIVSLLMAIYCACWYVYWIPLVTENMLIFHLFFIFIISLWIIVGLILIIFGDECQ